MTNDDLRQTGPLEPSALSWLLAPQDACEFVEQIYRRRPLHVVRDDHAYFRNLFDLRKIEELWMTNGPKIEDYTFVNNGATRPAHEFFDDRGLPNLTKIRATIAGGTTLILRWIHRWSPTLATLVRRIQLEGQVRTGVNAYITPPNARGFKVHRDSHAVFVLQLEGVKRWRIWPLGTEPLATATVEPLLSAVLRPGDFLYIPKGFAHVAETSERHSFHLTIALFPYSWAELQTMIVQEVLEESGAGEPAVPWNFLQAASTLGEEFRQEIAQQLARLASQLSAVDAVKTLRVGVCRQVEPDAVGTLGELWVLNDLSFETRLRRRSGTVLGSTNAGAFAVLQFPGGELRRPLNYGATFDFLLAHQSFAVGEIPTSAGARPADVQEDEMAAVIRGAEQIKLARELIIAGVLERD